MFYLTNVTLPFYLPIGFVGIYRWFWFFLKLLAYSLYKPLPPRNHPRYSPKRDVTIIVPTIDNGDEIKIACQSWLKNNPFEILFVTSESAKGDLEKLARELDPNGDKIHVYTVKKPNKRCQMVKGVNMVKTPLVVFADDDVLWPPTMLEYLLAGFEDKQCGGVGTSQTVLPVGKKMTIWEILAAYRISMRNIEITASTYIDGGVCCLSGRTAAYRSQILRDPEFQHAFTHEYWLGKYHQHSGDDKFMTRWLHSHQWKTTIQTCKEAELASTFKDNWRFLKQLLRWTRNTWRSDFRSLFTERQIWARHPFVAFTMLDKFFNPITLLAGPITVAYFASRPGGDGGLPLWVILTSYFVYLIITRLIKYIPHFIRRPVDVLALPVWIVFNIYFALMKVYCLFTLHVTDWGTRTGADDNKGDEAEDTEIYIVHNEIIDRSRGSSKNRKTRQTPKLFDEELGLEKDIHIDDTISPLSSIKVISDPNLPKPQPPQRKSTSKYIASQQPPNRHSSSKKSIVKKASTEMIEAPKRSFTKPHKFSQSPPNLTLDSELGFPSLANMKKTEMKLNLENSAVGKENVNPPKPSRSKDTLAHEDREIPKSK